MDNFVYNFFRQRIFFNPQNEYKSYPQSKHVKNDAFLHKYVRKMVSYPQVMHNLWISGNVERCLLGKCG